MGGLRSPIHFWSGLRLPLPWMRWPCLSMIPVSSHGTLVAIGFRGRGRDDPWHRSHRWRYDRLSRGFNLRLCTCFKFQESCPSICSSYQRPAIWWFGLLPVNHSWLFLIVQLSLDSVALSRDSLAWIYGQMKENRLRFSLDPSDIYMTDNFIDRTLLN